jgi:hypothetical protein
MIDTQQVVGNNHNYMQLIISKFKAASIIYVRFTDTLATYLLWEVETTKPNYFIKRVDRGLPRNLMTHDKS